ncbi:MAG: hypothetical protein ACPLX7_10115 [Candidatus Kapaibacteriota bacterium]
MENLGIIEPIDFFIFNYEPRPKYPHLDPISNILVTKFIEKNPDKYKYMGFDIPVGIAGRKLLQANDPLEFDWLKLTAKKIDVIFISDEEILLTEVKPKLNFQTLGQILGYTILFMEKYTTKARIKPAVLFSEKDEDILELLQKNDIETYQIKI